MTKHAVIIVDVLNDFVEGLVGSPHAITVIEPCQKLIEAARECAVPVIYTNDAHVEGDLEMAIWGPHAMKGSEGGEVFDAIAPLDGDIVIEKHNYSGFFNTELDATLKDLGVDSLVVAGLYSNICCRLTCIDAFQNGYKVTIAREAMTSFDESAYESDLEYLKTVAGADVVSVDEAIALLG